MGYRIIQIIRLLTLIFIISKGIMLLTGVVSIAQNINDAFDNQMNQLLLISKSSIH